MADLDDLHRSIHAIHAIHADVARRKPLHDGILSRLFETEHAGAGLIEALHERNIEVGGVVADGEVHVSVCPFVRAVDLDRAARVGPERAVCRVGGLGNVGACEVLEVSGEAGMGRLARQTYMDVSIAMRPRQRSYRAM